MLLTSKMGIGDVSLTAELQRTIHQRKRKVQHILNIPNILTDRKSAMNTKMDKWFIMSSIHWCILKEKRLHFFYENNRQLKQGPLLLSNDQFIKPEAWGGSN